MCTSRTIVTPFTVKEKDDDDDISKLINEGEDMVNHLCTFNGKFESGFFGFWSGIGAMFGLSGIKALQASSGRNSADYLRKANAVLQQTTQYYTLTFAANSVQLSQDLFTLISTSTKSLETNINLINTILTEEDQLLQIQIYGVYLICAVIIFFLTLILN